MGKRNSKLKTKEAKLYTHTTYCE